MHNLWSLNSGSLPCLMDGFELRCILCMQNIFGKRNYCERNVMLKCLCDIEQLLLKIEPVWTSAKFTINSRSAASKAKLKYSWKEAPKHKLPTSDEDNNLHGQDSIRELVEKTRQDPLVIPCICATNCLQVLPMSPLLQASLEKTLSSGNKMTLAKTIGKSIEEKLTDEIGENSWIF